MILKGLVEFKATHNEGRAPCNLAEYDILRDHLLAKKSIAGDFDKVKLSDKVRKLRSKFHSLYNDKNSKNRKNGKNGANICGYERVLYDLGRKIWDNSITDGVDEEIREIDSDGLKNNNKQHVDYLDGEMGAINSNGENIEDQLDDDDSIAKNDDDGGGGGSRDFCRLTMSNKKDQKQNENVAAADGDDDDDSSGGGGVDGNVHPPCAVLKNVVKNLEKNDGLIIQGTLKLALRMMKPERQKAWDEKWTKQCFVETQAYKKRKVLEKNLIEELQDVIIKTNHNPSPT